MPETAGDLQLDLFSWDRVKTGEGFSALARFDFQKAAVFFQEVLDREPFHAEASLGRVMADAWSRILSEVEPARGGDAAQILWGRIQSYSFGLHGESLRKALVKRLIEMIGDDPAFYLPPDLCAGRLHYETGDYERSETALRRLLELHRNDVNILCMLGHCLRAQGRLSGARAVYAKALLISPDGAEVKDAELTALIREVGASYAPIHGWLRGLLPLLEAPENAAAAAADDDDDDAAAAAAAADDLRIACRIHGIVNRAEKARQKGDHREMVEQRLLLKNIAPEVFAEYLKRFADARRG